VTGIVIVAWASRRLEIPWTLGNGLLVLFFGLCGGAIYVSVFLLLSTVSFWFEDRVGVHPPVWNMIAFGRYPLSIYSGFIQFLLSWIIPFGFATFYPSVRLLSRAEFRSYAALVPVVAVAFLALALFVWSRGVRRYSSTGS
jgi:ABC-2 type transport system permease protein